MGVRFFFSRWRRAGPGNGVDADAILGGGDHGTIPLAAVPLRELGFTRGAEFPPRPTLGEVFVKTADNPEGRRGEYLAQPATEQGLSLIHI